MDGLADDDSNFSRNEDKDCQPLSPIVEMDESNVLESSEQGESLVEDLEGGLKKFSVVDGKLNLETTMENIEERLSEPITPPEILRFRLSSLEREFDELKEFTELEKQLCHSECIPKEKVRLLEEDFAALHEKVQHLMDENSEFKKKMEVEDVEKEKLESELAKALNIQNESVTLVGHIIENLKKNIKGGEPMNENDLSQSSLFLEKCENTEENSYSQTTDPLLNSLTVLNELFKTTLQNKNRETDELTKKISHTKIKMGQMKVLLDNNSFEKTSLENEILKLKNCLTIDETQSQLVFVIKVLEEVINLWDESNIIDMINKIQGNKDVLNIIDLFMKAQTKTIFYEVAKKYKIKLLLHDEKNNNLLTKLHDLNVKIDQFETENKELSIEVNTLDHLVREVICKKVNTLEKRLCLTDHDKLIIESKSLLYEEKCDNSLTALEEDNQVNNDILLHVPKNNECHKLQKEINNFGKATESYDARDNKIYDLINEIENIVDSWDYSERIKINEFTQNIDEKIKKCFNDNKNSKFKVEVLRIADKFKTKLMKFSDVTNKLQQNVQYLTDCVDDYEQKYKVYKNTIKDLECKTGVLKEINLTEINNCDKMLESNRADEIKAIKKLMVLEITSLDKTEDKESLTDDSLENIFGKLMQIIMKKEQEISYSIQKQQKEEFRNFEQAVEKLNNKVKTQQSWINVLESENEKINTELRALKSLNISLDCKVKSLSNDTKNKTLEIDVLKSSILKLTTENDSLITNLETAKELIKNKKHSISSMEKDIEGLSEEIVNKNNIIERLKLKLPSASDKQEEASDKEFRISSSDTLSPNGKGDLIMVGINKTSNFQSSKVVSEDFLHIVKDHNEKLSEFGTGFAEILRKETDLVKNMLKKDGIDVVLSERFSRCHEKLEVLKDLIQIIGSTISEFEMTHDNKIQSIQTILEYKTKEVHDLKLSISKLYKDFAFDEIQMGKDIVNEFSQQNSVVSIMNELDQLKSECASFTNRSDELDQSARMGHTIIHKLRETMKVIIDENHNMTKLIHELRKTIDCEQEKVVKQKQKADRITKEKNDFKAKNTLLENENRNLKLEISQMKREMFSDIDIDFPDKMHNNEKITYINNILKQYSDDQKVYENVTDDLTYFSYQCDLMLSYIRTVEYELYFSMEQKDHVEKENILIKQQLFSQNIEINKFINQIVSLSTFAITSSNQPLQVMGHILSEYKVLKENEVKHVNDAKCKQDKINQQQKELTSLTKLNSSLKFELANCEDSIRNLRSELRSVSSQFRQKEGINNGFTEVKQEKINRAIQTEDTCCKRLQKKLAEHKEKIDTLSVQLTRNQQHQRPNLTSNPSNKQVNYLEAALGQAKEKIGRLNFALKQIEGNNQDLVETLKIHETCQERLHKAYDEIEKLKRVTSGHKNNQAGQSC